MNQAIRDSADQLKLIKVLISFQLDLVSGEGKKPRDVPIVLVELIRAHELVQRGLCR